MGRAKLGDGKSQRGHQLLVCVDEFGRDRYIKKRGVGGKLALMFVFVAVRGDQIGAIDGTVDRDFALGAAADGADFFALGGTESDGFAFLTDGTEHGKQDTLGPHKRQKRAR